MTAHAAAYAGKFGNAIAKLVIEKFLHANRWL